MGGTLVCNGYCTITSILICTLKYLTVKYLMNFDELHEITFFEDAKNAETNEKTVRARQVAQKRNQS